MVEYPEIGLMAFWHVIYHQQDTVEREIIPLFRKLHEYSMFLTKNHADIMAVIIWTAMQVSFAHFLTRQFLFYSLQLQYIINQIFD